MQYWTLTVHSHAREEMLDITPQVEALVRDAGSGVATVFVPHTSAGVTINENADMDVQRDLLGWLANVVPADASFRHAEGNSDAHIKTTLVGTSAQVPLVDGRLLLGRWQAIYFCEFDGPRRRQVHVALSG